MIYFQSILTGVAKFIHIFLDLPFHSPKSLVVCCGIINDANLVPLVNHPPTIISMFIKKTPKHLLNSNICSEPKNTSPLTGLEVPKFCMWDPLCSSSKIEPMMETITNFSGTITATVFCNEQCQWILFLERYL